MPSKAFSPASCLRFTLGLPQGSTVVAKHCYTVAHYKDDYKHGDLHEIACTTDNSWSIFGVVQRHGRNLLNVTRIYASHANNCAELIESERLSLPVDRRGRACAFGINVGPEQRITNQ